MNQVFNQFYKCKYCGYETRNDEPDCNKCKIEYCMMAQI